MTMTFDDLIGLTMPFYGSDNLSAFKWGGYCFDVLEDENDGYRSSLGEVVQISDDDYRDRAGTQERILANCTMQYADCLSSELYTLTDEDGHEWLTFGTENADDYYPYFTFSYTPKESV